MQSESDKEQRRGLLDKGRGFDQDEKHDDDVDSDVSDSSNLEHSFGRTRQVLPTSTRRRSSIDSTRRYDEAEEDDDDDLVRRFLGRGMLIGFAFIVAIIFWAKMSELRLWWGAPRPTWVLSAPARELPLCKKYLVYQFGERWGFGSEWNSYMRVSAAADKYGFVVLELDQNWNYGSINNYFQPRKIYCNPPLDWYVRHPKPWFGSDGWTKAEAVWYNEHARSALDDYEYDEYLSDHRAELRDLRIENAAFSANKSRDIFTAREQVLPLFDDIFKLHSHAARRLWRPTLAIEQEIQLVKHKLDMSVNHPTIGLYIRLGDKQGEWSSDARRVGLNNRLFVRSETLGPDFDTDVTRLRSGNLTTYLVAAREAHARLIETTEFPFSDNAMLYRPDARPRLAVMTAEDGVMSTLAEDPLAEGFDLIRTPQPELPEGEDPHFLQSSFNSWPMKARIAQGKALVRDLTLLARDADAFIVSGASNLGRLGMMLPGYEAATGPRDFKTNRFTGGRIRSVDTYWFPLSNAWTMFREVEDIPAKEERGDRGLRLRRPHGEH